ncbi:MAG TPA: hypothetical protein PLS12_11660, partial [Bacteroidales bacterium]|nr:hypothetical protein [Bacteroidales bacterium]
MTISTWPATFTAPANLTYCGDSATVNVTSTNPKGIYNWYLTNASSIVRGTTIGSGTTKISIVGATPGTGTDKIVYVEESAYANGTVITAAQIGTLSDGDNYSGAVNVNNAPATGFTVTEPITITELTYMMRTIIPDWIGGVQTSAATPATGTADVTFGVYGSKTNNGGLVLDNTQLKGTLTGTFTRVRAADPQVGTAPGVVRGNVVLQPGTYFITVSGVTNRVNFQETKICRNGNKIVGAVDDFNGQIIKHDIGVSGYGNPNQNSSGLVYNVKFQTAQRYCTRVPVTLKESCPCNTPANVTITTSDADTTLCAGQSLTLTSNAQANTTMFDFTVYKGSVAPANIVSGPTANISSISQTVAYADAGTYIILVRDKAMPTQTS